MYIENRYLKTIHAVCLMIMVQNLPVNDIDLDPSTKLVVTPITPILHLQKESGVWIALSVIQLIVYIVNFWNLIPYTCNAMREREREIISVSGIQKNPQKTSGDKIIFIIYSAL